MAGRPLFVVAAALALRCDAFNGTLLRSHRDATFPDARCALRLDRLVELGADWMLQLPVFDNATVLAASLWAAYVQGIYGPLSAPDYPVDLRCFIFWWAPRLPSSQIPWFRKHFHLSKGRGNLMHHHGKLRSANHDAWKVNLYGRREDAQGSGDDRNHDAALARARFDSHERVEIYHDGSDCAGRGAGRNRQMACPRRDNGSGTCVGYQIAGRYLRPTVPLAHQTLHAAHGHHTKHTHQRNLPVIRPVWRARESRRIKPNGRPIPMVPVLFSSTLYP